MDGISAIVAQLKEDNKGYINAASSVLPRQLVSNRARVFFNYLQRHWGRLDCTFINEKIKDIVRKHKALVESYQNQNNMKSSIDSFNVVAAYWDARHKLHNTYCLLKMFVGGLMTIFF